MFGEVWNVVDAKKNSAIWLAEKLKNQKLLSLLQLECIKYR